MRAEAYAKVNFTLEVFGKRADGYHALRSVVMPISLFDTLDIEVTDDGEITSDTGYDDDLCVKAAKILRSVQCAGETPAPQKRDAVPWGGAVSAALSERNCILGARIRVAKRIPAGGGLGGGSADAAAVLRALNELWKVGLSREELAEVGAQVGSDVPALVLGGPVVMEGRGEKVEDLRLKTKDLNLVLINPGVHSSTKEVYAACVPRSLDGESATARMVEALGSGNPEEIAAALMNDLQPPAAKQHPEIADALVSLRTAGVLGAVMSGSGSSVFGIVRDAAAAERIASELNVRGYQAWPMQAL